MSHFSSLFQSARNQRILAAGIIIVLALAFAHDQSREKFMMDGDDGYMRNTAVGYSITQDAAMAGRAEESMYGGNAAKMIAPTPPASPGAAPIDEVLRDDRLIIRTASVSAVVDNVRTAIDQITVRIQQWEGFVNSSSVNEYDLAPSGYMTVRVPVEQFDAFLSFLRDTYRVVSESVSGDDVTEQYVDNEAALRNLRASEEQFLTIMNRATQVEDVLNVQQQLERVRGEIERLEARQENLSRSAALSTVSISLSTEREELPIVDPSEKWSPLATFKEAIRDFRQMLITVADTLIAYSLYLTAAAIAYLAYELWVKMHRR